jgi:hypothetical protein
MSFARHECDRITVNCAFQVHCAIELRKRLKSARLCCPGSDYALGSTS